MMHKTSELGHILQLSKIAVWHTASLSCMLINNTLIVPLLKITCFLQSKASAQDTLVLIPDVMQLLLFSHVSNGFLGLLVEG